MGKNMLENEPRPASVAHWLNFNPGTKKLLVPFNESILIEVNKREKKKLLLTSELSTNYIMMESENHHWMLNLVIKNVMRNNMFTKSQRSTYKTLFNNKGKIRNC